MSANYTFQEIVGLTRFLKVLLGLGVAMAVVSVMSSFMQADLLSRSSFSEADAQSNDSREQIIGLLNAALYLFTVVIFGRWIVRTNRNIRAFGADGLRTTPGWAVGYFFVPIANLWKPYQAMKDLWRASNNPAAWTTLTASAILPAWWTLWLLSNAFGQMSFRVKMAAKGLEGLQASTYVDIVTEAMDIPLCLVAFSLVSQIANAQNSHVPTSPHPS
jgi:hypothetical protein